MADQHTFPQNGDNDYAENFAQLIGQANLVDHVITGMTFSVDYSTPQVTISTGVAIIGQSSVTTPAGETRLDVGHVVQLPQTTESLTDSATNHVYIEPGFGTDDNGSILVTTNTGNASADALKIGEIDTSGNTKNEDFNRYPALVAELLDMYGEINTNNSGGRLVLPVGTDKYAT